ncbi:MAG: hypothetical protein KIT68_09740 [Phycisphaeraceae bacterium]|nr:hypothetical protein [Phycisphaeraceae bacterium]
MTRAASTPTAPGTAGPRRRGLSLVEAAAALVVLAVAAPASLIAISDASVRRSAGVLAARARCLAVEKLEDVIADRHSATRGWSYIVGANYAPESPVDGFAGFSRTVAVQETGASLTGGGAGFKTVTVTVRWTDPRSGDQRTVLSTILTDY